MSHDYCWGPPLDDDQGVMATRLHTIEHRLYTWLGTAREAMIARDLDGFLYACAQMGNEVDEIERLERFDYWEKQ